MTSIHIQVSRSKVSVEGQCQCQGYMLGKGGISVLQTAIFHMCIPCDESFLCILMKPFQKGNKVNKLVTLTVTFDLHTCI